MAYYQKQKTVSLGLESVSVVRIFHLLENLMFTMNAENSNMDNGSLKNNSEYNTQFILWNNTLCAKKFDINLHLYRKCFDSICHYQI